MKIIVAGCGKVGTALVSALEKEGHDLVAVDISQQALDELTGIYDIMCVCGTVSDNDTLTEAGVADCSVFIATTASDETNMLACFLARQMGAKHTIASIRNPEYNDKGLDFLCRTLGISMAINPDRITALELFNILKFPSAENIESFSGKFELIELVLKEQSAASGLSLAELRRRFPAHFLICAVQRDGEVFIPQGNFVLQTGDRIALTAAPVEAQKLLRQMGILQKSAKRVIIAGAGRKSHYLSELLTSSGVSVTVIEIDRERCESFTTEIVNNSVYVINGDGTSREVLEEEGIDSTDAFVSLTGVDETNILSAIYAQSKHVPKVIAKVSRGELYEMAEKLGLDCVISPVNIVTGQICRYVRAVQNTLGSNIEALYKVMDGKVEALEFSVGSELPFCGIPLSELKLRKGILIVGIIRGRRAVIPGGAECIRQGDRVVVICSGHKLNDLADIFEPRED